MSKLGNAKLEKIGKGKPVVTDTALSTRPEKKQAVVRATPWWQRLPQLLNLALYQLQSSQNNHTLDYDPLYLHLSPAEINPRLSPKTYGNSPVKFFFKRPLMAQRLNLDSFRFMLDQMPGILAIEFFGHQHDPLEAPDLFEMIKFASRFNGAPSTLKTNGLLLANRIDELLESPLQTLVIDFVGHKPSFYSLLSGRPLTEFMTILQNTERLLKRRNAIHSALRVTLSMTVDVHNVKQIPEMIQFAESLGADCLQLNNFVEITKAGPVKTDRTLYRDNKAFIDFLQHLENTVVQSSPLQITLPTLLNADMSRHRYCKEPFSTIAVDAEFNVSGCSQQYLDAEPVSKVWDSHSFNNAMYQGLRNVFNTALTTHAKPAVPLACQNCPKNMPNPS